MRLVPDVAWLAMTVWMEARGEPYDGKVAVAEVILRRAAKRIQSDGTIPGTVLWPLAFSGWNARDPNRIKAARLDTNDPCVHDCLRAVAEASAGSDVSRGATHYLNEALVVRTAGRLPAWVEKMRKTATIGNHTFYADHA